MTADLVVEKIDGHSCAGFVDETALYLTTQPVVVDNVELKEHVLLRPVDAFQDAAEGGVAVDEQFDLVGPGKGSVGHRFRGADGMAFVERWAVAPHRFAQAVEDVAALFEHVVAGFDVALEAAAAEDPVGGDGDVGHRQQEDDPGDRALGGAALHHRFESR